MGCGRCRAWLEDGDIDPLEAHFLTTAVSSRTAPVRLAAARLLLELEDPHYPWLQAALAAADVDPATGEFR